MSGFLESRSQGTGQHGSPSESGIAKAILKLLDYTAADVKQGNTKDLLTRVKNYTPQQLSLDTNAGIPTINDIVKELMKPGRDPREDLPKPILKTGVIELKDLAEGMILNGTVRNVSDFGAFVDIGVHQDGLVHISQLSDNSSSIPWK